MIDIPNYKIDKALGTGGMSTVYLATHEILDRQVALKIMSPSFLKDGSFKDCFINEGRIISKLNHPHVIHIYDIGISNDACYMAIELLEAETLRHQIDNQALSIKDKQRIITQIASALNAAHQQNFIHRDIKPGNILFRKNGDAVLTDFGISKIQDTEGEYTTLGFAAGTPSYMPPEFSMDEELTHQADIYSLGVVFFEMLTGEKPYKAKTAAAISYEHVNADIPKLDPSLSQYQKVIDKALAKKPEDRFSSVMEFSKAIEMADISMAPTIIAKRQDVIKPINQNQQSQSEQNKHDENYVSSKEINNTKSNNQSKWKIAGIGLVLLTLVVGVTAYFKYPQKKPATIKNITNSEPAESPSPDIVKIDAPKISLDKKSEDMIDKPEQITITTDETKASNENKTSNDTSVLEKSDSVIETEKPKKITIASVDLPKTNQLSKPERPKETKPEVLTQEQKTIVITLLENCIVRASTIIKEQIRITKNESIIEEIKNLKSDSGRTKFITDTQRQIQTSKQRINDNINKYFKNISKLKSYQTGLVNEQLTQIENEQSTKQVSKGIIIILKKHLQLLSNKTLTLEICKQDLDEFAKNISSTF